MDKMNGQRYCRQRLVPYYADADYKEYAREDTKREVGILLFDLLEQQRTPVVIDFEEYVRPEEFGEIFGIEIVFTPVQHRHIQMNEFYNSNFVQNYKLPVMQRLRNWWREHVVLNPIRRDELL